MADSPAYPGAPRWVKILGFISVVLVVAFVAAHLAGGGFRHHGHVGGQAEPGTSDKGPS
jgi:hypothetical protein